MDRAKLGASRGMAITGSIAGGKSSLGKILEEKGWRVIEADVLVHQLYQKGAAGYGKLVDALGDSILSSSQELDRGRLAAAMRKDPSVYATVNLLIHPMVREAWKFEVAESLRLHPQKMVAVVIPLLLETGAEEQFEVKAMVACREAVSRQRLLERGLTPEAADFWIGKQWSVEEKVKKCDRVIWNEGSQQNLKEQAGHLVDLK